MLCCTARSLWTFLRVRLWTCLVHAAVTPSVGNKQSLLPFLLDLDPTCFQIVSPLHVHLSEQDQAALHAFIGKPREASPGAFIG